VLRLEPVVPSPFQSAAIEPLLRRIAGTLDPQGRYAEVLARGEALPAPGEKSETGSPRRL
jgi:hypothetical protein